MKNATTRLEIAWTRLQPCYERLVVLWEYCTEEVSGRRKWESGGRAISVRCIIRTSRKNACRWLVPAHVHFNNKDDVSLRGRDQSWHRVSKDVQGSLFHSFCIVFYTLDPVIYPLGEVRNGSIYCTCRIHLARYITEVQDRKCAMIHVWAHVNSNNLLFGTFFQIVIWHKKSSSLAGHE